MTEERKKQQIKNLGKGTLGFKFSEATKAKMRLAKKNYIPWNKGKNFSDIQKQNISKGLKNSNKFQKVVKSNEFRKKHRELMLKEKNPNWLNGKSFEEYTVDWTETLRRSIRERDRYICFVCKKEPATYVHHIDYDKKNCNPNNLITLCNSCHTKTNHHREMWIKYFKETP